jgi:hypothetical protein
LAIAKNDIFEKYIEEPYIIFSGGDNLSMQRINRGQKKSEFQLKMI